MGINRIVYGGRLAADPIINEVGDTKVAKLKLISNRVYFKGKGNNKEKCEEVCSMNVEIWGGRAKAAEYLSKGDACTVDGYIKENNWEDKDGNKRYDKIIRAEEIEFGKKKGENGGSKKEAQK